MAAFHRLFLSLKNVDLYLDIVRILYNLTAGAGMQGRPGNKPRTVYYFGTEQ
jgi:hypothetical protein